MHIIVLHLLHLLERCNKLFLELQKLLTERSTYWAVCTTPSHDLLRNYRDTELTSERGIWECGDPAPLILLGFDATTASCLPCDGLLISCDNAAAAMLPCRVIRSRGCVTRSRRRPVFVVDRQTFLAYVGYNHKTLLEHQVLVPCCPRLISACAYPLQQLWREVSHSIASSRFQLAYSYPSPRLSVGLSRET